MPPYCIENNETALSGSNSEIGQIVSSSFSLGRGQNAVQNAMYLFQSQELANRIAEKMIQLDEQPDGQRYPILWTEYPEDSTLASPSAVAGRIEDTGNAESLELTMNQNYPNPFRSETNIEYTLPDEEVEVSLIL